MNFNKVLKWIVYIGIFLIPFIPFIVAHSLYFPFITGKNFAFRILIEIIALAWIILALRDQDYRPKRSWILISVASLLGILAISTIFGENPFKSFWSNFERMEGLVAHLHYFLYFLIAGTVMQSRKLWDVLWNTSIGISFILSIYTLLQLGGALVINQGGVRVDATFGNATYLAAYMMIHVFIILLYATKYLRSDTLSKTAKWWIGSVYTFVLLLDLNSLYHTATRGAMLGLLGGFFLASVLLAIFGSGKIRKISFAGILGIFIIIGGFLAVRNTDFVRESMVLKRFSDISLNDSTTSSRFIIWGMSLEGFKKHPIIGWGQENYNLVFNKYYDPRLYAQEPWFDRAHNIIFDWLVSTGILGFLIYLSIFVSAIYMIWRKVGDFTVAEKAILTGVLGAYLAQNMFVFDNLTSYILFFTLLAYIHSRSVENTAVSISPASTPSMNKGAQNALISVLVVGMIFSLYFFNIKPINANSDLIEALNIYRTDPETGLEVFNRVLDSNTFARQEATEQLLRAAVTVFRNDDISIEIKQDYVTLAKDRIDKLILSAPKDARHYLMGAQFLRLISKDDLALTYLEKAHEHAPKKQIIFFEDMNIYVTKGDMKSALLSAKDAFLLAPGYRMAGVSYASTLLVTGRANEADKILMDNYGTTTIPFDQLINAATQVRDYNRLVLLREERVRNRPTGQSYFSLAISYVAIGRFESAIRAMENAMEFDQQYVEQGRFFISELRAGRNPVTQ